MGSWPQGKRPDMIIVDDVWATGNDYRDTRLMLERWFKNTAFEGLMFGTEEEPMNIGGEKCHLCGAPLKGSDVVSEYYKCGALKERHDFCWYRCGTTVGKDFKKGETKTPVVVVGGKCIQVP